MHCPACGNPAPSEARFCPSCGNSLARPDDQRRVVTVVFADLVGFTTLSEDRDPEHVKNLVDRCFERLAADVTAYGGKVDKIVGDAMVALFGAPVAHEDDAERAVRAALQMQRTTADHAADIGVDVRLRIGVNTGEVLVGALRAGDDYTAMGDVVNVASRLQSSARPGDVVVGPATYDATAGVIRYDDLGPIEVRGRVETIRAYLAQEAVAPPGYRPRRVRTPLIGREPELGMLRHALEAASSRQRPHFVLVSGEAGMGKSRLGEEVAMLAHRDHDAAIYVGRCVPYGEANPWWPVSEILRQAFGIDLGDPSDASLAKIRRGVELATRREGPEIDRTVDGLLYLMGLENPLADVDPTRALDEAITALTTLIEGIGSRHLVVLFIADLHWADQHVLDLVDRLLERIRALPFVLIATARPELQDRWSPEPGRHNALALHLDPLDEASIEALIGSLVGEGVSDELKQELRERSGGNPFFVEELVALLTDAGVLDGRATGDTRRLGDLPSSLRGLVAARLDGVGTRERAMIEDAAVIGRVGSVPALVELGEQRGEHDVAGVMDELVAKDLLVLDDNRFEFKSDLVREVAYETLTKSARARRHAAVAAWLAERAQKTGREDEQLEQIAHHWSAAADLAGELGALDGVPHDVRQQALTWLERAAFRALERDVSLAAEQFFDAGLGLLTGEEDDDRQRLLLGRAAARVSRHDLPGARRDVVEVLEKADAKGDDPTRCRALVIRGEVEQREGDVDEALATLEAAMTLANDLGDQQSLAAALRQWGMTQLFRGELEQAETAIEEARQAFQALGDRRSEAWALQNLAWIAFSGGDTDLADRRLTEAASLFEDYSDWGGRAWALGLLGFVRLTQGRLEEAGELADEVIVTARGTGDRWGLGITLVLRSSVALWLGRTNDAFEAAQEASEVFEAIDDAYGGSLAASNLTRAAANLGRTADARAALEEARTLFDRQGGGMTFIGVNLSANVLCQVGDARGALSATADVDFDQSEVPLELLVARGLALVQSGRAEEALVYLDRAFEEHGVGPGDEGARTFALAVRALAEASLGDADAAIESGARVADRGRGTYLDETYADLGAGLAHAQRGEADLAAGVFRRALDRIDATDDRLSQAIVRLARARALEAAGDDEAERALKDARDRFGALGIDPYGWETAFDAAATGGVGERATGGR